MNLRSCGRYAIAIIILLLNIIFASAQIESRLTNAVPAKARTDSMLKAAYGLLRRQQLDPAIVILNTIVPVAQKANIDSTTAACFFLLGTAYRYKSKNDSAVYYWNSARILARRRQLPLLLAALDVEYFGFYNRLGKADSAAAAINRLRDVLPSLDSNSNIVPKIEMYLGHDEKHHLRYTEALVHYYKALRMFTRLKDSINEGTIYVSLANAYVDLDQKDKALDYHRQAANILTLLNRRTELVNELLNLTDLYYTSGQLDSGEVMAKRALPIAIAIDDRDAQAYVYMNLGNIAKRKGQLPDAERYLLQGRSMAGPLQNDNLLIECYQGLGELYMTMKEPAKAQPYFEQHLALARKNDDLQEMIEATWDLSENESALHHYQKAFEYRTLYSTYRDSSFRASSLRSNAEMESKYQAEKKENEIALLKKDQALKQLELQKEKAVRGGIVLLTGLLLVIGLWVLNRYRVIQKTKRMLEIEKLRNDIAQDLHDDIGSALSSININSSMALHRSEETGLVKSQLEKIKTHSEKIMERMGDIVWAVDPGNDSTQNLFSKMKEFLAEMLEPLDIRYELQETGSVQELKLPIDKRKEIYLVFKEAVNNAAKYSRCKNIHVHLGSTGRQLELQISDDGIGFDRATTRRGNGLINMEKRAAVIGGHLGITTAVNAGTSITLTVPVT